MSTDSAMAGLHLVGLEQLRRRWGWFFALGLLLIVLGMVAISAYVPATIITTLVIGWLMIASGAMEIIYAFSCKAWAGFFIDLLTGILYIVVGFMIVANPLISAEALTLLIAVYLMLGGLFRIVIAVTSRFHHRIWLLLGGVVNVVLGAMIWRRWPDSGLAVIGLFVGIDMIFNGCSLVILALRVKKLPTR